ncbi:MAG TPA: adenylate kinase [Bacilli bacterium]|nr:adenylate kinase [Bacilli bacterium]
MRNIIFVAPPGAGKGTQSTLLVEKYGYDHISTGDLLRNETASGSKLGNEITTIMKSGSLVSDEIVLELLKNKLETIDANKGFILDGFPRNINQAKELDSMLDNLDMKLDHVLYLEVSKEEAKHRVLGRISCPKCGRVYNKYSDVLKPMVGGKCDHCGTDLVSRTDDNEETFNNRFDTYLLNTEPLLKYYEESGILNVVKSSESVEETFKEIEEVIANND